MNVRKFIAATARDALHKVKELLGPDAIILSNRAIPGGVEIMAVAASDMEMMVSPPTPSPIAAPIKAGDDYSVRLSLPGSTTAATGRMMPPPPIQSD